MDNVKTIGLELRFFSWMTNYIPEFEFLILVFSLIPK
jgi:hypothetical protein